MRCHVRRNAHKPEKNTALGATREAVFTQNTQRQNFDVVRADVRNGFHHFYHPSIGSRVKFDVDVKILKS